MIRLLELRDVPIYVLENWMSVHNKWGDCIFIRNTTAYRYTIEEVRTELSRRRDYEYKESN